MRFVVETKDLIPIPEAAKRLGIHYSTLYRWVRASKITTIKVGKHDFIASEQIEKLTNKRDSSS